MKRLFLLLPLLLMSSCAYVQTHKNVEQAFCSYEGYRISDPLKLYQHSGTYYVEVQQLRLTKHYPIVHDELMFTEHNEPIFRPEQENGPRGLMPISAATATVLQRPDGYVSWSVLRDEIDRKMKAGITPVAISGAGGMEVRAQVVDADAPNARIFAGSQEPAKIPTAANVLSGADRVIIDAPLTVVYNCAIPCMAPFYFFWNMFNGEDN